MSTPDPQPDPAPDSAALFDELDALLQRMLALPVEPAGGEEAGPEELPGVRPPLNVAEAALETAPAAGLAAALDAARAELRAAGIEPEYLEARDAEELSEVAVLGDRPVLIAVAAQVGGARLIDNVVVRL